MGKVTGEAIEERKRCERMFSRVDACSELKHENETYILQLRHEPHRDDDKCKSKSYLQRRVTDKLGQALLHESRSFMEGDELGIGLKHF